MLTTYNQCRSRDKLRYPKYLILLLPYRKLETLNQPQIHEREPNPYGKHLTQYSSHSLATNLDLINVASSSFMSVSSSHGLTSKCVVPCPRMCKHQEQGENSQKNNKERKNINEENKNYQKATLHVWIGGLKCRWNKRVLKYHKEELNDSWTQTKKQQWDQKSGKFMKHLKSTVANLNDNRRKRKRNRENKINWISH